MKTKITLTGLLLASTLSFQDTRAQQVDMNQSVQQTIRRITKMGPHHAIYYKLMETGNTAFFKTTQNQSRLIAHKYREFANGGFVNRDTVRYTYTGSNLGTWLGEMNYDVALGMVFDPGGSSYDFETQRVQTMDGAGNITERTYNMWDNANANWKAQGRDLYIYNAQNKLVSMQYQPWSTAMNNWGNDTLYEFTYDTATSKLAFIEGKTWNDTGNYWNVSFRYAYNYDVNGDIFSETLQSWSPSDLSYKNVSRYKYTYNNGNMINATYQDWNTGLSNWANNQQMVYTYNGSGDLTESTVQNWNNALNMWQNDVKYAYTHDGNGNTLTETKMTWGGSAYTNTDRVSLTYNNNNQPLTIMTDSWDGLNWANNANSVAYDLYYEELLSVPEVTAFETKIYPVPASNQFTVELNSKNAETVTMTLFDVQGRAVKQWKNQVSGQFAAQISVSELPAGSYWLKIQGQNAVSTKPVVVIR